MSKQPITTKIEIATNAAPFLLFSKILEHAIQVGERSFNLCDFPAELIRVETDYGSADAGKLLVTFYPSDSFLVFASAILAGNVDSFLIENIHGNSAPSGE